MYLDLSALKQAKLSYDLKNEVYIIDRLYFSNIGCKRCVSE